MTRDLTGLFSPKSIAVIGASRSPEKVGAIALKNIIDSGFTGNIYPVNPKDGEIYGLKCYIDIESLPEVPDLAVVAIPSDAALEVLSGIGTKGIKNVLIFSAGFKEIGLEGDARELKLIDISNKFGLNVLGPNCLGFANNSLPVNVTFGQIVKETGNLKIASQSGALAASLFDWCRTTKLGFDQFITLGNKAIVNENHILKHWQASVSRPPEQGTSDLSPIGLYLESIADGVEFVKLATEISKTNPIFMLKPGKSKAAAKAMHSHTGSIAGEDSVLDIALKQSGVIRCQDLGDFFDIARGLAWENVPKGPKVAVVSNAGGPAVLSTDSISEAGLELAEFSLETKAKFAGFLPRMASFLNPVDVLGDALAERFGQALEAALQEKTVDAALVILTPQLMTQIDKTAEIIGNLSHKYPQPILCSFIGGDLTAVGEKVLNSYKIPSYPFPERAIKTLAAMWHWEEWRTSQAKLVPSDDQISDQHLDTIKNVITSAKDSLQKNLDNFEANDVVTAAGIATPPTSMAENVSQAETFANSIAWPIVLKVSSPGLLHKADVGGVITHLHSPQELNIAWNSLLPKIEALDPETKKSTKIQVQKEIAGGIEVIVGIKRDPNFGPVMLFGAGGKYAEILLDRNLHLLPITHQGARELVEHSKVFNLLNGFRDDKPYDLSQLYDIMVRLGKLVQEVPDISEIEINPLIVTHTGSWAVDSKVVLTAPTTQKPIFSVPQYKTAKVLSHNILATKFHSLIFEPETPLVFLPGQFISVKVGDQRINAYSIAKALENNKFELLIDISPGGVGSKFFESLKEGDSITYLGPAGRFTPKYDDNSQHMIMLGTGSGISPLRCMIEDELKVKGSKKPITLYFGLRFEEDIFWKDVFDDLAAQYPNFKYKICLSKPSESWQGSRGHLTDFLKQDIPDATLCSAYLCGNKDMLEEATNILLESGCPREKIYSEKYY